MANTKPDFWDVEGTSLHTMRWNVDTLDGTDGLPPRKGANVEVPGIDGAIFRAKKWASRVVPLTGWVSNMDADGVRAATSDGRLAQLNENIKAFKTLLVGAGGQQTLTKRVRETTGLVLYTAKVEFHDLTIAYPEGDRMRVLFTVDAVMADPYWYIGTVKYL